MQYTKIIDFPLTAAVAKQVEVSPHHTSILHKFFRTINQPIKILATSSFPHCRVETIHTLLVLAPSCDPSFNTTQQYDALHIGVALIFDEAVEPACCPCSSSARRPFTR